jgi:phosphomannomutase
MKKQLFLFDVDGTITPPRKKMTPEFKKVFKRLVKGYPVYLVSGSDIQKIREQVPNSILRHCSGIFASSANEYWIDDKVQYENVYIPCEKIVKQLEDFLNTSKYEVRTSNHIEHRPGMLNFSVVGRNADDDQRTKYADWDKKSGERTKMAVSLMVNHPEIDVKIGGEISIDIYPRGLDKSQAVTWLRAEFPSDHIVFFGDRTDEEGNDYSVVTSLGPHDVVHPVESHENTYDILKSYIGVK